MRRTRFHAKCGYLSTVSNACEAGFVFPSRPIRKGRHGVIPQAREHRFSTSFSRSLEPYCFHSLLLHIHTRPLQFCGTTSPAVIVLSDTTLRCRVPRRLGSHVCEVATVLRDTTAGASAFTRAHRPPFFVGLILRLLLALCARSFTVSDQYRFGGVHSGVRDGCLGTPRRRCLVCLQRFRPHRLLSPAPAPPPRRPVMRCDHSAPPPSSPPPSLPPPFPLIGRIRTTRQRPHHGRHHRNYRRAGFPNGGQRHRQGCARNLSPS